MLSISIITLLSLGVNLEEEISQGLLIARICYEVSARIYLKILLPAVSSLSKGITRIRSSMKELKFLRDFIRRRT